MAAAVSALMVLGTLVDLTKNRHWFFLRSVVGFVVLAVASGVMQLIWFGN